MKKFIKIVSAILLPPLGVGLQNGFGMHLLLNILLTISTFGVLGILHALYVVLNDDLDTVHWDD